MALELIRWINSFMTTRRVILVLDGEEEVAREVETGIPQGSPATPIFFVTYLSGIFDKVEKVCDGVKALSPAGDIAWRAAGKSDQEAATLTKASETVCDWASRNGVAFDHGKTEAMFFSRGWRAPTASVTSDNQEIPFNKLGTRWLGTEVWKETVRGKNRFKIRDLSRAVLDFLITTDAERQVLTVAEDGVRSEASEWGAPGADRRRKREEAGGRGAGR
jgi:hypothetical protein